MAYHTTEDQQLSVMRLINVILITPDCLLITAFLHTVFHVYFQQQIVYLYSDIRTFSFRHTDSVLMRETSDTNQWTNGDGDMTYTFTKSYTWSD